MATLLKVLINLADIKPAGGVALRVGIHGEDDLLDVVIGELVDIEVTRQPSS